MSYGHSFYAIALRKNLHLSSYRIVFDTVIRRGVLF